MNFIAFVTSINLVHNRFGCSINSDPYKSWLQSTIQAKPNQTKPSFNIFMILILINADQQSHWILFISPDEFNCNNVGDLNRSTLRVIQTNLFSYFRMRVMVGLFMLTAYAICIWSNDFIEFYLIVQTCVYKQRNRER